MSNLAAACAGPNRLLCAVLLGALLAAVGCSSPRREAVVPTMQIESVPPVLRGTIGAEASIRGTDPVLVSGLGIVVGLNGTGGGEYPQAVLAHMEREVAKGGIGKGGVAVGELEGTSPQQFLRSPDIAIVIVQAVIAPGAPTDSRFDVFVTTLPGSSVTSLEGGTLWTTELRIGQPSLVGAVRTRKLAEARGPIFINPFSEPAGGLSGDSIGLTRTRGRVLGGGRVTDPLKMQLVMDDESHSRARTLVSAINSRFPRGPGDEDPTARGRGSDGGGESRYQSVAINVPNAFREDPAEFLQLLRYTRIDQSFPQEFAKRYVDELKENPVLASDLSWSLQAIGKTALPFLAPMYEYPEIVPRMAALEAGAKLGDQRTAPHLVRLAQTAPPGLRAQAIELLGRLPRNPNVNFSLRGLLGAEELDVRVAAYEALYKLQDPLIQQEAMGHDRLLPKFLLETVPSSEPMVYVTQQGRPRIVLFGAGPGRELKFTKPMFVSMWSNRLILNAESPESPLRMRFVNTRTGRVLERDAPENAVDFIKLLAHRTTPEDPSPGLDLSYSEVVGALYELTRQGALEATFATEEDRLRAAIMQAGRSASMADRPEGGEDEPTADELPFKADFAGQRADPAKEGELTAPDAANRPSRIVPLNRPKKPSTSE